jgi:hypothetical protein
MINFVRLGVSSEGARWERMQYVIKWATQVTC